MNFERTQQTLDVEQVFNRLEWMLLTVAAIFLAFSTFTKAIIDNDRSRLASVDSLVERGTWVIDRSRFHQEPRSDYQIIDKIQIGDHFYSSKPPVLSFLMAGEYWVLHHAFGYDFNDEEDRRFLIWALTYTFTGIPFLWIAFLFRIAARWFILDPMVRFVGLFIVLFCNEHLGFAETINNHIPGASLLFSSMVFAIGLVHGKLKPAPWLFVLTGLLAGLLPTVELPASFFCVLLWAYLVWWFPRQTLLWFTLGAVPPLALNFGLMYAISGSIIPFYLRDELYRYKGGSYWNLTRAMDAAGEYETKHAYFYHLSVGRKGLFSLYPVLLFSLAHVFFVASRQRLRLDRIAFLALAPVLLVCAWTAWAYNLDATVGYVSSLVYYFLFASLPLLVVSYLVHQSRKQDPSREPELPLESAGLGVLTFVWMVVYTFIKDNYGGSATGFRWFMFFTPALQFFGLFTLNRMRTRWQWALVCILVGISFYSGWQATVQPWSMNFDWPVRFLGKWITR